MARTAWNAGFPSYEEWAPAVAYVHPSCSRGLRRAVALLRNSRHATRRPASTSPPPWVLVDTRRVGAGGTRGDTGNVKDRGWDYENRE